MQPQSALITPKTFFFLMLLFLSRIDEFCPERAEKAIIFGRTSIDENFEAGLGTERNLAFSEG